MTTSHSQYDLIRHRPQRAPRLLVSVRSKAEAIEAISGGVDILDIKEPANGPLGMASPSTIDEIANAVQSQTHSIPVSVALGELTDWMGPRETPVLPAAVTFAKVGLSGLRERPDWRRSWESLRKRCDDRRHQPLRWVAVAYADAVGSSSPKLSEILQAAIESHGTGLLIDTYGKGAKTLLDHVSVSQLCEIANECRRADIFLAIAGRLTIEALSAISECQPDILAIRSAACRHGNRQDAVEATHVAAFRDALHRIAPAPIAS